MDAIAGLGLVAFLLIVYFFPAAVAVQRKHHDRTAIFVLNLLLGWTVLGWIIAIVSVFTATGRTAAATVVIATLAFACPAAATHL